MTEAHGWTVSDAVVAVIGRAIEEFERDYFRPDFAYYPVVTWRSGGQATKPGEPPVTLPDRYDIALIPQADLHASDFIAVACQPFEVLAFVPRDEDLASERRLIDFDGQDIVVR